MPRHSSLAPLFAAALFATACRPSAPASPPAEQSVPAVAGEPLPVSLESEVRPMRAGDALPTLAIAGAAGAIRVTWELRDGPCMIATATARRDGADVVLRIARGGDPVALCLAGEVVYRYEALVRGVPAGRYRVRVVEEPAGAAAREVGAGDATVRSGS